MNIFRVYNIIIILCKILLKEYYGKMLPRFYEDTVHTSIPQQNMLNFLYPLYN